MFLGCSPFSNTETKMELIDEGIDIADLQFRTVNNRAIYTFHMQKLLAKCTKHRIKSLEKDVTNSMTCDESTLPTINLPTHSVELDVKNQKLDTDLKNTLKEQMLMMKILHKKSNCPISKEMDKL